MNDLSCDSGAGAFGFRLGMFVHAFRADDGDGVACLGDEKLKAARN